jgi:hypothetical protein
MAKYNLVITTKRNRNHLSRSGSSESAPLLEQGNLASGSRGSKQRSSWIPWISLAVLVVFLKSSIQNVFLHKQMDRPPPTKWQHSDRFVNDWMARTGRNYPVCKRLVEIESELQRELLDRTEEEAKYQRMMDSGDLNCGKIRVGSGIFEKR